MQENKKSKSTASLIEKLKASVPVFDSEDDSPEEELDDVPTEPGQLLNASKTRKFMKGFKQS